ncbi:hypothetical protein [Endozoicomonas sp.]|uniref:hypothetical protein n=2 Tax=Endozoicomonas TaxID=305899 RepID=UPI003AF765D3
MTRPRVPVSFNGRSTEQCPHCGKTRPVVDFSEAMHSLDALKRQEVFLSPEFPDCCEPLRSEVELEYVALAHARLNVVLIDDRDDDSLSLATPPESSGQPH